MSEQMTKEEAAYRIQIISRSSSYHWSYVEKQALSLAISALRYQERHRWRKLEEENPPHLGHYQVFPVLIDGVEETSTDSWFQETDVDEEGFANDPEGEITHWAYLLSPPEEEVEAT